MQKLPLSRALRAIASAVDALSQEDLDALTEGKGKLVYVPNEGTGLKKETRPLNAETFLEGLTACIGREEARELLSEISNKDDLSILAKSLKIHIVKHDRREEIENKIIEFVIGGRLRSEAIRSVNMKADSERPHGERERHEQP